MDETMNMENTELDNDAIMPEGWSEEDDFFDDKSWSGNEGEAAEEDDFFADASDTEGGALTDVAPTTEPAAETPTTPAGEVTAEEEAPTTEPTEAAAAEPRKIRFKARIDHEDIDAEIDESDLPAIYQKAAATDRYQAKLAKANPTLERMEQMAKRNGYASVEEMLDAQEQYARTEAVQRLVDAGTPQELAEDYVDRRFGRTAEATSSTEPKTDAPQRQDTAQEPAARDFAAEIRELWAMRPELKGTTIPSEVAAAAASGQNLTLAYLNYEAKQSKSEADKLRRENDVYKQNAAAAAKAPVKGVTGGGATDTQPKDPFLEGFDSSW